MAAATGHTTARWLGFAGLIPFHATAIGALVVDDTRLVGQLVHAQLAYGAVIASFLGAVHWGLAIGGDRPMSGRLIVGILPSLAGWALVVLDGVRPMSPVTMILFVALFAALYAYDRRAAESGAVPEWYGSLRGPLTVLVICAYAVTLVAVI